MEECPDAADNVRSDSEGITAMETANDWLAKVHLPKGAGIIALRPDLSWMAAAPDECAVLAAKLANLLSGDYEYSVAHGGRGVCLAHQVADKLGGTVELPTAPKDAGPPPPGVVI